MLAQGRTTRDRGPRRATVLTSLLLGTVAVAVLAPATAANAEPSIDSIEKRIATESARLEKVVEQYNKLGEEIKATQASAGKLAKSLVPLQANLDAANARVTEIAVQAYKGGSLAQATAVLDSANPSIVVDRLVTLTQISKLENAKMADAAAARANHDVATAKMLGLAADQKAKRKELEEQKKKINADLAKLYALRRQAYGNLAPANSGAGTPPPYVAGKAGKAVNYAYAALGKPYEWGAAGPSSYDCSGLTLAAWRAAGVSLPHNAEMQWNALSHIKRSSLQPGDLVFYSNLGHVAIYVGSNKVIHSPTFGDVVRIASVDMMTPYGYARPG